MNAKRKRDPSSRRIIAIGPSFATHSLAFLILFALGYLDVNRVASANVAFRGEDIAEQDKSEALDESRESHRLDHWLDAWNQFQNESLQVLQTEEAILEAKRDQVHAQSLYFEARLLERNRQDFEALRTYQRAWRYFRTHDVNSNGVDATQSPDSVYVSGSNPMSLDAGREVLRMCLALDRIDEAARYAALIPAEAIDNETTLLELASLLTEAEEYAAAIRYYDHWMSQASEAQKSSVVILVRLEIGRLAYLIEDYELSADEFAWVLEAFNEAIQSSADPLQSASLLDDAHQTFGLMGEGFLEAGRYKEAEDAFRRADHSRSDPHLLNLNLARIQVAQEQWDEAREPLEDLLLRVNVDEISTDVQQKAVKELEHLYRSSLGDEWSEEFLKLLTEWLKQQARNRVARVAVAEHLFDDASRTGVAIGVYQLLWQDNPSTSIGDRLTALYLKDETFDELVTHLADNWRTSGGLDLLDPDREILNLSSPNIGKLASWLIEHESELMTGETDRILIAAFLADRCGRPDYARKMIDTLATRVEDSEYETMERQWILELLAGEQYEAAVELLEQRMARQSDDATETRFLLSGALGMIGRGEEAWNYIEPVLQALPDSVVVRSRAAWVRQRSQDYARAQRLYASLIEQFDDQGNDPEQREQLKQTRMVLAGLDSQLERPDQAVEWLEQILDEFPDDAGALNDLGYLWVDRGEHLARAYGMIRRAVELEPENASFRDSLGWALYRLTMYPEAEQAMRKAIELREGDPEFLDHLGDILHKAGKLESAIEAWEEAAAIYDRDQNHLRENEMREKIKRFETD